MNIIDLLASWKMEPPLAPEDQFPDIADMIAVAEEIFVGGGEAADLLE